MQIIGEIQGLKRLFYGLVVCAASQFCLLSVAHAAPSISSHAPGDVLVNGSTVIVDADDDPFDQWRLTVGETRARPWGLYSSGERSVGDPLKAVLKRIPANGEALYVRLSHRLANAGWKHVNYEFIAANADEVARITSPALESPLASGMIVSWQPGISLFDQWRLTTGTSAARPWGVFSSGVKDASAPLQVPLSRIATDGGSVFMRLSLRVTGSSWNHFDYQYTAATAQQTARIVQPVTEGTVANGQTLQWLPGLSRFDQWRITTGATKARPWGNYNSGDKSADDPLEVTLSKIPTDGSPVYVRLWHRVAGGRWSFVDSVYESTVPAPPPVASNDVASLVQSEQRTLDVLDNDTSDLPLDRSSILITLSPQHASDFQVNENGTVSYTHRGDGSTEDRFRYIVFSNTGLESNEAEVTLTIEPLPNVLPVAANDTVSLIRGTQAMVAVLSNDTDSDGVDATSIEVVRDATHGELSLQADGTIQYQHDGSADTVDAFDYTVKDTQGGLSNVATVTVTIDPVPAPQAGDDSLSLVQGEEKVINVLANDSSATGLDVSSILITTGPLHADGFKVNGDGTIAYRHDASGSTDDSFTYTVATPTGVVSNEATVLVSIEPLPNLAPVAANDAVNVYRGLVSPIEVLLNDTDADGSINADSIAVVVDARHGSLDVADGRIVYHHDGSAGTDDTFSYTVKDDLGELSNVAVVTVTVDPVPAPQAVDDASVLSDASTVLIDVLSNDISIAPLDSTSILITRGPQFDDGFQVNGDGTISYTHDGKGAAKDSFQYKVATTSGVQSNEATVAITIEQPTVVLANNDEVTLTAGVAQAIDVLANDIPAGSIDVTSVVVTVEPGHAQSYNVNADGTVSFTAGGDGVLADSFSYKFSTLDGTESNTAQVLITIEEPIVNIAPAAENDAAMLDTLTVRQIPVLANDTDSDGALDVTSVAIVEAPLHGEVVVHDDGSVSYTHQDADTLADSFSYTVNDDKGLPSNVAVVTVTMVVPNQPPVAVADAVIVYYGGGKAIDVLANDTDNDGSLDPATVTVVDAPLHGSVVVLEDGSVLYSSESALSDEDSFSYTVADAAGLVSNTAIVGITLQDAADEAPVAVNDTVTVVAGKSKAINVTLNDSDLNGDIDPGTLNIVMHPENGTAIVTDGNILYTHTDLTSTTDTLYYTVADYADLESNVATVKITIEPVSSPEAFDDLAAMPPGGDAIIDVLANDTANTELDNTSVIVILTPEHASEFDVRDDGSVYYQHDGGGSRTDSFVYKVYNVQGMASNEGRVDITIGPKLLTINDLSYEGAFALPSDQYGESSLNYASGIIEVDGNSLYIAGHTHDDAIAEFAIPALVNSRSIADLNTPASPTQSFIKVIDRATGGNPDSLDQIVGMEAVNGSLVVNLMEYYDGPGDNTFTTLVVEDAGDLSVSNVSAIHQMEGRARSAGWLSPVPVEWRDQLGGDYIAGNSSGHPIISRLSVGPSAFAVNLPDTLTSSARQSIAATELQGYSLTHPLHEDLFNDDSSNTLWNHMSLARYGFIVPGTSTYLTVGWSAGHQSGVGYKNRLEDGSECPGYCANSSADAHNYYWLWNVDDWMAVQAGDKAPHEVAPYEWGQLDLPFQTDTYLNEVGGASYDAASGLLYMSILRANDTIGPYDNPPVIVAYRISTQ